MLSGGIIFREFEALTRLELIGFFFGVSTLFGGAFLQRPASDEEKAALQRTPSTIAVMDPDTPGGRTRVVDAQVPSACDDFAERTEGAPDKSDEGPVRPCAIGVAVEEDAE